MIQAVTSKIQREKVFHNQWAKTVNLDELLVRESFEAPTAIENRFALQLMGNLKGKKILDLGCGAGETSVYFALQGAKVQACDIAEEFLTVAGKLAKKFEVDVSFAVAEAGALPYPNDHFDYVFGNGVLHHVELSSAAREIRRVLKPGGKAIFIEPLPYNPVIHIYRMMAKDVRTADERPLSFKQLKDFALVFNSWQHREFWFFSLLIFLHFFLIRRWHPAKVRYWKRVIESGEEYRKLFSNFQRLDAFCLKFIPFLNYLCWNTVMEVKK